MKVYTVSLGCDKNLVDTEVMLGILNSKGYTFTDDEDEADVIIINTCCFIHDACEESIRTIIDLGTKKHTGNCKALIVTGCLSSRYSNEIHDELPEVDAICSATAYDKIAEAIESVLSGNPHDFIEDINALPLPDSKRIVTTGGHFAYLKIAEGCDKRCTYCAIPYMRGSYRSVPMERLLKEAECLAKDGVRELILVAQETTVYGKDLYGYKALPKLLRSLCKIEDLKWIRILYCYPEEIDDDLIEVIKSEPKICHYLDMPIQHASDNVLRRMGRRTNYDFLVKLINHIREEIPDICLRTTLISGFPGETEADHELLMDFVNEMEFDRLGVFTYSREEGTAAYDFADQVEQEIKELRRDELMELQQEIVFSLAEDMIGKTLTVFVEGKVIDENAYISRTYKDAPDVDGYLFIQTSRELMTGDFVRVRATQANEYDLIGELIDESAQ